MIRELTIASLTLATLAARASAQPPDAAYVFSLRPQGPAVAVTLTTRARDTGTTDFTLDESWGGVSGHGKEITEISAADASGTALTVDRASDHAWIVTSAPGQAITVTYLLREPPGRAAASSHNDYRTTIRPDLFLMIGNLGLLHPTHLDGPTPRTYTLTWRGFDEEGWRTISSFGPGPGPATVTVPPDRFRNALLMAGSIRVHERTLRGTRVAFSIHGRNWAFEDELLVDLGMRVITAERAFFNDFSDPFYLVTLVPTPKAAPGSFSLGGTGLTNCFALFCNSDMTLGHGSRHEPQVKRLLAHEYFHNWNGGKIRLEAPEGAAYWFSEGFTDFYARRLLLRARLFTPEEFTADLNSALSRYDASPVKNAPNDRVVAEFWKDRNVSDLPYNRGGLIALAIDEKIRQTSGGARTLDDVVKDLVGRAAAGEPALTPEAFFALIEKHTTAEFAGAIRTSIIDGADVPVPDHTTEPALTLTPSGAGRQFTPTPPK